MITEIHVIHIGGRIQCTETSINIDRITTHWDGHALRQDDLHHITSDDIVLDAFDVLLEGIFTVTRNEILFPDRRSDFRIANKFREWLTHRCNHFVESALGNVRGVQQRWIHMSDVVNSFFEVIEHHDVIRDHQKNVRSSNIVWWCTVRDLGLDVTHGIVAEISDQPSGIDRETLELRIAKLCLKRSDIIERIVTRFGDDLAVLFYRDFTSANGQYMP